MFRLTQVTCLILVSARIAAAGVPFIEHHHHVYSSPGIGPLDTNSQQFVDVPGSEKTVTVPAGTAFITWTMALGNYMAVARPMIGGVAPPNSQLYPPPNALNSLLTGSWATPIEGGTIEVKLQAAFPPDFDPASGFIRIQPDFGTSWTLIVFQPESAGVPAVGGLGLSMMLGVAIIAGCVVFSRRRANPMAILPNSIEGVK